MRNFSVFETIYKILLQANQWNDQETGWMISYGTFPLREEKKRSGLQDVIGSRWEFGMEFLIRCGVGGC